MKNLLLAQIFYRERHRRGFTLMQMGKILGISHVAYRKLEKGISLPGFETLAIFSFHFAIEADELLHTHNLFQNTTNGKHGAEKRQICPIECTGQGQHGDHQASKNHHRQPV